MPAERYRVSLEPRPLQMLYSKYAPQMAGNGGVVRPLGEVKNSFAEPPAEHRPGSRVLDLRNLRQEVCEGDRLRLYLDLTTSISRDSHIPARSHHDHWKLLSTARGGPAEPRSRGCCRAADEGRAKVQDVKKKLRLVVARQVSDDCRGPTVLQEAQQGRRRVVQLPMLQIDVRHSADVSADAAVIRDTRHSLRRMLSAASTRRQPTGPTRCGVSEGIRHRCSRDGVDSYSCAPAPSDLACRDDACAGSERDVDEAATTASSDDVDRVDSALFNYVFDSLSLLSDPSSLGEAGSQADAAAAHPCRPCTAGAAVKPQRASQRTVCPLVSPRPPRSPADQGVRGWNVWLPQKTAAPPRLSWPSASRSSNFLCCCRREAGCDARRGLCGICGLSRSSKRLAAPRQAPEAQPRKVKAVPPSDASRGGNSWRGGASDAQFERSWTGRRRLVALSCQTR